MSAAVKYRHLPLGGSLAAHFEKHADGTTRVTSAEPLAEYPRRLTDRLLHWAAVSPEHTLAAKRHHGGEWRRISYAQALASARSIAQALLDLGLSPQRPLVILSEPERFTLPLALSAQTGLSTRQFGTGRSLLARATGRKFARTDLSAGLGQIG